MMRNGWRLVYVDTQTHVSIGDSVTTRDGDLFTVEWGDPPQHFGSSGRVYVKPYGGSDQRSFFPTVFGLRWVEQRP